MRSGLRGSLYEVHPGLKVLWTNEEGRGRHLRAQKKFVKYIRFGEVHKVDTLRDA